MSHINRNGIKKKNVIFNLWSGLLKNQLKVWKHGCVCCHFDQVCAIMTVAGICGRSVCYIMSQLSLLFIGKERTNITIVVRWGAQAWSKISTSVGWITIEHSHEACKWKYMHIFFFYFQINLCLCLGPPLKPDQTQGMKRNTGIGHLDLFKKKTETERILVLLT